jgi:cell division protease FtsH
LKSVSIEQVEASSGGHTQFHYGEDLIETRERSIARVRVLLAGRAAELVVLGDVSDGAGGSMDSDLGRATRVLAEATLSLGMGPKLRWRCEPDDVLKLLTIDREARQEVENELTELFDSVVAEVRSRRAELEAIARELRAKRTLDGGQVLAIIKAVSGDEQVAA